MTRRSVPLSGVATRAGIASLVGVLVVAGTGRLLGFVREVLISGQYGTTVTADAFFTIQQVPTIASAFVIGPFMIAYIPFYATLRGGGFALTAFDRTLRLLLRGGSAISIAMVAVGLAVIATRGRSDASTLGLFLVIMAAAIIPILISGLSTVVLHAEGHHILAMVVAAVAPAGMLVVLLVLTAFPLVDRGGALPASFVAGAFASCLVGWVALRTRVEGFASGRTASDQALPGVAKFRREMTASAIETIGFSLNQALTVVFAAGIGGGAVATNAYSSRIASFAFSLVSPLNVQAQTWMTRDASHRAARRVLVLVAALGGFVIASAAVLAVIAPFLVRFVYLRGSFTEVDAVHVTALLAPYAAYGAITATNQLVARYLFVMHQGSWYTRVMIAAYLVGNGLKLLLVGPLGLEGLIWSSVIAEGAALAVFVALLLRRATTERAS